mmetsp:Transcript_8554/g.15055  ORF Transcript_8554/g.15055 Transcript_8554/m.15055 type:complete len:357 (+) Transcript_8554:93-1163(+)
MYRTAVCGVAGVRYFTVRSTLAGRGVAIGATSRVQQKPLASAFAAAHRFASPTQGIWKRSLCAVPPPRKQDQVGDQVVDIRGDTWVYKQSDNEFFWYNKTSWETRNDRPPTADEGISSANMRPADKPKPQYATDWYDPRFPEHVQYVEFNTKRKYYHNTATNEVTWSPPDQPDLDVFEKEIEESSKGLTPAVNAQPAKLWKRVAATGVDFAAAFGSGLAFGGLVFVDLGEPVSAQLCVAISTWVLFMGKDMIFEQGTRSPGKRLLKLEIVRVDGQLPSRWNNMFRNLYLPVYTGVAAMPPAIFALTALELGLVMFTQNGVRLGDLVARTKVIEELPDRATRLAEKIHLDEEDDKKE